MRQFTSRGNGLNGAYAAEAIMQAVLDYFDAEITVYDRSQTHEMFRVGSGNRHDISGVHIHPKEFVWNRKENDLIQRDEEKAIALIAQTDFNSYLGTLLQALTVGSYRRGFNP